MLRAHVKVKRVVKREFADPERSSIHNLSVSSQAFNGATETFALSHKHVSLILRGQWQARDFVMAADENMECNVLDTALKPKLFCLECES